MIYFVQAGDDGPIKIGCTEDLDRRLASLQTGSPYPLRLLGTIPAGREFEQGLHERLAEHRLRGEWFAPSVEVRRWAAVGAAIDGRRRSEIPEPELLSEIAWQLELDGLMP